MIDLAPLDMWQVQTLLPHRHRRASPAGGQAVSRQPVLGEEIAVSLESAEGPVPPLARALAERL